MMEDREQRWRYTKPDGTAVWLVFDPEFPCISCNRPVGSMSMGGPATCPSCDCGLNPDGTRYDWSDLPRVHDNQRQRLQDLPDDPAWAEYEAAYQASQNPLRKAVRAALKGVSNEQS